MTDHYGRHEIEAQRHRSTKGKAQTEASRREILRKALTPLKRSKYRNVPTVVDGVRFDSKREANRYAQLVLLQKAGKIEKLERQVAYRLAPSVKIAGEKRARAALRFKADFRYVENGLTVVEDAKGHSDTAFRIRQHLMKAVHGIDVRLS